MKDVAVCDKLRGGDKQPLIRRFPNGGTPLTIKRRRPGAEYIGAVEITWGSETSQYPEEKKSTEIPLVVASERGAALKSYSF